MANESVVQIQRESVIIPGITLGGWKIGINFYTSEHQFKHGTTEISDVGGSDIK
ncbi:MAG: hypothetical protein M3297_03640 [Thermoproteota archaeon]|nr:hypothetical protein [Thermoproteota archaeon]